MFTLQDDFAEPDFEELAARLTAESGIPWTSSDVKMWSGIFGTLKPDTEPDDGND
jgi:hypothetical protein